MSFNKQKLKGNKNKKQHVCQKNHVKTFLSFSGARPDHGLSNLTSQCRTMEDLTEERIWKKNRNNVKDSTEVLSPTEEFVFGNYSVLTELAI